jgi:hypothetical protein
MVGTAQKRLCPPRFSPTRLGKYSIGSRTSRNPFSVALGGAMKILRRPAACAPTANDILRVDGRREYLPSLDGQISDFLSSTSRKNISLSPSGKSALPARAIPSPQEGRFAVVTDVGSGMRWTRQRQARFGARTNGAEAYGEVVWS